MVDVKLDLEKRARVFATAWHESINQRRNFSGLPYITHPAAVVEIVRSVTDDEEMLAAAWLHDVVEDTPCSLAEVEEAFGTAVASLVRQLTNVATKDDGNRASRAAVNRAHMAQANGRAKTIKLADVIHNLSDICFVPRYFALRYVAEKRNLLLVLEGGDPTLHAQAYCVLNWASRVLEVDYSLAV